METPGERLSQYIENKGFTKKEFCEMADLAYNNFVRVLNGTRPLGINVLDKVKSVLTNLNVNWLLYNEGPMEVESGLHSVNEASEDYKKDTLETVVKRLIHDEMEGPLDRINNSIYILMKRDIKEKESENKKNKKSS